ncbi:MAG: hypothetical protein R3F59_28635 [Myxococcota bacterium]
MGDDLDRPFVLVVANADLSPEARLALDGPYDPGDPSSWVRAADYAQTPVDSLPVHTLRTLPALAVYFPPDAIPSGGLVGTETTCVRRNDPGPAGSGGTAR